MRTERPVTYLHVGAPKSGTTYLQSVLWDNRDALREDGVLFPGEGFLSHTHAALDLQGARFGEDEDPAVPGAWPRLVEEIRAWNGTAIISQELFSPARPDQVDRALRDLAFSEIHVVYTARDLVRQVPAAWQEDIKNRNVLSFAEFVIALRAPAEEMHPLGIGFWRMQDAADVLARWGRDVDPGVVHVITIPPGEAPRDLLWRRFCAVTGLDPDRYATAAALSNTSLGVAEANLLRRLNIALGAQVRWPVYDRCVKGLLGVELAARPGSRRIVLPARDRLWLVERCREMVDNLRKHGYDVVGDLCDLVPDTRPELATGPDDPPAEDMLDAAVTGMTSLLGRLQLWRDEIDRLGAQNAALHAEGDALRAERDARLAERDALLAERDRLRQEAGELREILRKPATKLFVRRLSEKNRAVMRARIIYWNVVEGLRRLRRGRVGGAPDDDRDRPASDRA